MFGLRTVDALHPYPGCGHFFTDPEQPDYDRGAADLAWRRIRALLQALSDPSP